MTPDILAQSQQARETARRLAAREQARHDRAFPGPMVLVLRDTVDLDLVPVPATGPAAGEPAPAHNPDIAQAV